MPSDTPASRTACPPRPHGLVWRVLHGLWLLAAALLVLAGVLALVLQLVVLPHIDSLRPQLAQAASRMLGVPLHIGQIVVTRPGWQPEIEMRDVALKDAQGHNALHVETIQAVVSLQAVARLGFERLAIVAPRLEAQRHADGSIDVAGLRLAQGRQGDSGPLLNWLLSQPELSIRDGSLRWTDQQRRAPPLELTQVQASLKNISNTHSLQIQATPPAGWGQPFHLASDWKHPLLRDRTVWRNWVGVGYADLPEFDVSDLRRYFDVGRHIQLRQGHGSARVWANFDQMKTSHLTVELHLSAVDTTLGKDLPPLRLKKLDGMGHVQFLSGAAGQEAWTLATSGLQFTTEEDQVWPGGNVRVALENGTQNASSQGSVEGEDWDLGIVGQLAGKLPLGEAMLDALHAYRPGGQLQAMRLEWQGDIDHPTAWSAKGRAQQIGWRAQQGAFDRRTGRFDPGIPGVEGATVQFDVRHDGGSMDVTMRDGAVTLPGVFEEPRIVFAELHAPVRWQIGDGGHIRAELPQVQFANADARGTLHATWHTSTAVAQAAAGGVAEPATDARFPGVLDLEATIESARAERVYRYLPLSLGDEARHYVRDAVRAGDIRNARVRIEGDLAHIPYGVDADGKSLPGTFRFEVPLRNAHYRFVPPGLQNPGELPWPALTQLDGTLVIDRHMLRIENATGRFSTAPDLKISTLAAHIPDLSHNLAVGVIAKASGPLQQALHLANTSPLTGIAHHALEKATATGQADLALTLGLPIHNMAQAQVEGKVQFRGNDVRITPGTPLLAQTQGEVAFNQDGFELRQVRTRMLGGSAALEGGLLPAPKPGQPKRVIFHAKGDFSAEGLRGEAGLGPVARLARQMQGSSRYQAALQFDRGAPELTIDSDLRGMALNLPAPLHKPAAGSLPLHLENTVASNYRNRKTGALMPEQDRLLARLGRLVSVEYRRDVRQSQEPRVLRGSIAVGEKVHTNLPPLPDSGVHALVQLDTVDVDAWLKVIDSLDSTAAAPATATAARPAAAPDANTLDYLPTLLAIQADALTVLNRHLDNLVMGGTREGRLWKLAVDARQISGSAEYLQPAGASAGAVKARLEKLVIEPANVQDVKELVQQTQDPEALPALDIEANHVDLLGYRFDRITLLANNANQPQASDASLSDAGEDTASNAWRIHRLAAAMPHGLLQGSGVWGRAAAAQPAEGAAGRRFVALNVRLETSNLGGMLDHFGFRNMAAGGAGVLAGTVRWRGSPVAVDRDTLAGTARLDVRQGRITRIDPGAAKLISLLSIDGLTRLGEVSGKGFAFDRIGGTLRLQQGVARSNDLEVRGSLADVKAVGSVSLKEQTVTMDVLVQPKIDLGGAALIATAINPLIGAGSYVAQLLLSKSISSAASQVMTLRGPLLQPVVTTLRGDAARSTARQILASHAAPRAIDPLWDWWPATGGTAYGAPGEPIRLPVVQPQAAESSTAVAP